MLFLKDFFPEKNSAQLFRGQKGFYSSLIYLLTNKMEFIIASCENHSAPAFLKALECISFPDIPLGDIQVVVDLRAHYPTKESLLARGAEIQTSQFTYPGSETERIQRKPLFSPSLTVEVFCWVTRRNIHLGELFHQHLLKVATDLGSFTLAYFLSFFPELRKAFTERRCITTARRTRKRWQILECPVSCFGHGTGKVQLLTDAYAIPREPSHQPYPLWLLTEGFYETFVHLLRERQFFLAQRYENITLFEYALRHIQGPLLKTLLVDPLNTSFLNNDYLELFQVTKKYLRYLKVTWLLVLYCLYREGLIEECHYSLHLLRTDYFPSDPPHLVHQVCSTSHDNEPQWETELPDSLHPKQEGETSSNRLSNLGEPRQAKSRLPRFFGLHHPPEILRRMMDQLYGTIFFCSADLIQLAYQDWLKVVHRRNLLLELDPSL